MTYRKLLNRRFLHLLLLYKQAYLKIGRRAHLSFGMKWLLSLPCMVLEHQILRRILLEREQQNLLSFPYSWTPFPQF